MLGSAALLALLLGPLGCGKDAGDTADEARPEPGELVAGVASARIPAPLGIGTAGFGPFDAPSSTTPFADIYPGTTRIHGHPQIDVVVVSRGETHELVFVRLDAVGVFQQLRRALVLELEERLDRPMDDALIIGATHTHSGPGRIVDGGGIFDLIADTFFPDFYDALIDGVADAVEAAYADLAPARIGTAAAYSAYGHSDRRCEDGLYYENGDIPLIAVEREGTVDAVVMAYAIHGTVLGIDDLTLSQDVSGAIEQAVEDRFDHPVQVTMFNSWGADMAPGCSVESLPEGETACPEVDYQEGAARPDGYDEMDEVGQEVADQVEIALADITWLGDEPTVAGATHRTWIDREWIGYDDDTFPFEYGGVYCEGGDDCDPATTVDDLDEVCLAFTDDYPAPNQTVMSAGQIGDLYLVTFPGEPGTLLAEQVMADIRAAHGEVGEVMFLGYTQDYIGYSILEDDWWQGGYEASGALWGPRQGEYLAERATQVFGCYMGTCDGLEEPPPITPFDVDEYTPYQPEAAAGVGQVAADVPGAVGASDVVSFTVQGTDPWLGAPAAWLETADGAAVTRPNGAPAMGDDYNFRWDLEVDPSYKEDASERTFYWTLSMPARRIVPGGLELAPGDYRLRVEVPLEGGGIEEVISSSFTFEG